MKKAYHALARFVWKRYAFLLFCVFLCVLWFPAYFFYRHAVWHDELIRERARVVEHLQTGSPKTIVRAMRGLKRQAAWWLDSNGKAISLNGADLDCRLIALGYELRGDYAKTLKWLACLPDKSLDRFDVARIDFKKGDKAGAFKGYCQIPSTDLSPGVLELNKSWIENAVFMKEVSFDERRAIRPLHLERLSPFRDYDEFLRFINEEYEALGRPAEQAEAVEWYRAMAPVISGEAGDSGEVAPNAAQATNPEGEAGEGGL